MRELKSWQSGYGMKGGLGPNTGKKATTFLCVHPLGLKHSTSEPTRKRVFSSDAATWAKPVGLWYRAKDEWHLNTVVDGDNLPDWAAHYTTSPASHAVAPASIA